MSATYRCRAGIWTISVQNLLQTTERTARNTVSRLVEAGVLVHRSTGRRDRVFECPDMMDAFTESAREQPADNLTLEHAATTMSNAAAVAVRGLWPAHDGLGSAVRP